MPRQSSPDSRQSDEITEQSTQVARRHEPTSAATSLIESREVHADLMELRDECRRLARCTIYFEVACLLLHAAADLEGLSDKHG